MNSEANYDDKVKKSFSLRFWHFEGQCFRLKNFTKIIFSSFIKSLPQLKSNNAHIYDKLSSSI